MSEYIIECDYDVDEGIIAGEVREEVVRCRDCEHATISSLGHVKYCEMFVLPDKDGCGADPQVMLPSDFFCGYGELRGDARWRSRTTVGIARSWSAGTQTGGPGDEYVMECTLTLRNGERMAEFRGFATKEVIDTALEIFKGVIAND